MPDFIGENIPQCIIEAKTNFRNGSFFPHGVLTWLEKNYPNHNIPILGTGGQNIVIEHPLNPEKVIAYEALHEVFEREPPNGF